jgi:hypothetical protein
MLTQDANSLPAIPKPIGIRVKIFPIPKGTARQPYQEVILAPFCVNDPAEYRKQA